MWIHDSCMYQWESSMHLGSLYFCMLSEKQIIFKMMRLSYPDKNSRLVVNLLEKAQIYCFLLQSLRAIPQRNFEISRGQFDKGRKSHLGHKPTRFFIIQGSSRIILIYQNKILWVYVPYWFSTLALELNGNKEQ